MTNPFEQADGVYLVLMNGEGQHSIWPAFIQVPAGWKVVLNENSREACLEYIELNWRDTRPLSLQYAVPVDVI